MRGFYFGRLTPSEFYTFAAMLYFGGWHGDVRLITRPMIQDLTGMSRATITRALAGLRRKGFIVRKNSPHKKGALWKVNTESNEIATSGDFLELFPPREGDLKAQIEPLNSGLTAQYEPPRETPSDQFRNSRSSLGGEVDMPQGEVVPPLVVFSKRKAKGKKQNRTAE